MNEYIFYTAEGHTIAPNENIEVENCQVLGITKGNNPDEAKDNLLKNCPWIAEAGFNRSKFVVKQIVKFSHEPDFIESLSFLGEEAGN